MALNSSGPISLGGSTVGQSVNLELGLSGTAQISLNDSGVRTLAGIPSGAITIPSNFWGKANHVPFSSKATFTTNSTWTVPSGLGITAIRVKAWGAPGGGIKTSAGVGGYAQADISATAGQVFYVAVGGGGQVVTNNGPYAAGGTNGGGRGSSNAGAGGGGFSGLFSSGTYSQGTAYLIAGVGGGGHTGSSGVSGNGGGTSGTTPTSGGGSTGGTQNAGGAAGTGYAGITAGSALKGGEALNNNSCNGGGAGWYGGGGGSLKAGGGSGYVTGTNTSNLATDTISDATVPNSSDVDYVAPYGKNTSTTAVNGAYTNSGYVVILY